VPQITKNGNQRGCSYTAALSIREHAQGGKYPICVDSEGHELLRLKQPDPWSGTGLELGARDTLVQCRAMRPPG
jgi:hypothetical protein